MNQASVSGVYGEFRFDPAAVRSYWYSVTLLFLVFVTVATFGVLGPVLLLWLVAGHWWITKEFQRRVYEVDEDSVNVRTGVLFHQEKVIPLEKITDIRLLQGPLMRRFGVYSVLIQTAGTGGQMPEATMVFESHSKAVEVRERIMTARRCFRSGLLQTAGGEE